MAFCYVRTRGCLSAVQQLHVTSVVDVWLLACQGPCIQARLARYCSIIKFMVVSVTVLSRCTVSHVMQEPEVDLPLSASAFVYTIHLSTGYLSNLIIVVWSNLSSSSADACMIKIACMLAKAALHQERCLVCMRHTLHTLGDITGADSSE